MTDSTETLVATIDDLTNGTVTAQDLRPTSAAQSDQVRITVPTRELLTLLAATAPFASPEEDSVDRHAIRIEWDGERLHAMSADGYRTAWCSWGPDDVPELARGEQEPIGVSYGSPDDVTDPISVIITPGDAKDVIDSFKVAKKDGRTPLRVTVSPDRLIVHRSPDTGFSEHTLTLRGVQARFPDVRGLLMNTAAGVPNAEPIRAAAFTPSFLKDFCTVMPGRVLELTFSGKLVLVKLGLYFRGSIAQATPEGQ